MSPISILQPLLISTSKSETAPEIVLTDSEILARGSSEIIPCGDSEITAVPAVVMGGELKF